MATWTDNGLDKHAATAGRAGELVVRRSSHRPKDGSPNPVP